MEEEAGGRGSETNVLGVLVVWEWSWGVREKAGSRQGTRSFQASRAQPRSLILAGGGARKPRIYIFSFLVIFTEIYFRYIWKVLE